MKTKLLLFFFFCSTLIHSQSESEISNWFDLATGNRENLFISSGVKVIDGHTLMRGQHPFLLQDRFYQSKIKYNNQVYYELIAYDIYKDELLVSNDQNTRIRLPNNKVEYFYLGSKKFVYLLKYGFCELMIQNSSTSLYKKHTKKIAGRVNRFKEVAFQKKESLLLSHNGNINTIKSSRDWIKNFPTKRSIIKSYYSKNKKLLKSNPDVFMKDLFKKLTNQK